MRFGRSARFEFLEDRALLAVTTSVTAGGDLVVKGTADGAVEIVAVSPGAFRVSDNGVVVADSDVLTGVTDDIRIVLTDSATAADTVTLDLGGQAVDQIYARLGSGDNTFTLANGAAGWLSYRGGSGADSVTLAEGASVDESVRLHLGAGDNSATIGGAIDGSLVFDGRAGNDSLTIAATASIGEDVHVRLGAGDNTVAHLGSVGGDLKVVSANAEDAVDVADTATVGGETVLGLGEQRNGHGRGGRRGCGDSGGEGESRAETNGTSPLLRAVSQQIPSLQAALQRGAGGAFFRGIRQ
jgi:hypothetical protein